MGTIVLKRPEMRARRGYSFTMRCGGLSDQPRAHLEQIALLALEVSRRPELLPLFLGVLSLVPNTVSELRRGDQRRLAA